MSNQPTRKTFLWYISIKPDMPIEPIYILSSILGSVVIEYYNSKMQKS